MSVEDAPPTPLPAGAIQGRLGFEEAIRASIEQATARGWNRLCWMDADFADWPLGERRTHDALQAWSRKGRKLILMANRFDLVIANHHRFVSWRRQWAHIVECWHCPGENPGEFPSLVLAPDWSLQRVDRDKCFCIASESEERVLQQEELRQYWLEKSAPGFPANVLGL